MKSNTTEPIAIKRLQLQNVRCFESVDVRFKYRKGRGQWTLLLGDNGVGKSTVLKSIAIALSPLQDLMRYPQGRLQRRHAKAGSVSLDTTAGIFKLSLGGFRDFTFKPDVFAYGAARGTATGGPERAVDLEHPMGSLSTLFGQAPGLIHAESWLVKLGFAAGQSSGGTAEAYFDAVRSTLIKLLPGVDKLEPTPDGFVIEGPSVGRTSFDGLSDGYLTTIGWVCDLLARWAHANRDRSLDGDFADRMTGLVLVDELDLHLHPSWQTRIVGDLRARFPQMSFIATTHNPLTLLGARAGEIQVLQRVEEGVVVKKVDLPRGIRTDEVLTGPWFGLGTTIDRRTTKLLQRYQDAVLRGDPVAEELEIELQLRMGTSPGTPEDWKAREIVRQLTGGGPLRKRQLDALKAAFKTEMGG